MKTLILTSLLTMGFVASSALTAQGAPLTNHSQFSSQAAFPPLPDPNSGKPPQSSFFPPLPDPNSGKPPAQSMV